MREFQDQVHFSHRAGCQEKISRSGPGEVFLLTSSLKARARAAIRVQGGLETLEDKADLSGHQVVGG